MKKRATRRPKAPPVATTTTEPSGMYVRIPLSPEQLVDAKKYVDAAADVAELVSRGESSLRTLLEGAMRAIDLFEGRPRRVRGRR